MTEIYFGDKKDRVWIKWVWEEREKNDWAFSPSIADWVEDWKAVPPNEKSTMERLVILGK